MSKYYKIFYGKGKTYKDLFEAVDFCINKEPELSEAVKILDYGAISGLCDEKKVLSETDQIKCFVNTGGSEGVYVDCNVVRKLSDGLREQMPLATYKTLDEGLDTYIKMGMIAGAFTILAEEYICANC